MKQQTVRNIKLGDGNVYCEIVGEGAPFVFLHAAPFDSRMWDEQWRDFRQHYQVIRYDLRGLGKSGPLEGPISHRQELYRVLNAMGVERATLIGCSVSGETILDAALDRPELISALIIVSAVPGGFELQGEPPKELMQILAEVEQGDVDLASELKCASGWTVPFASPSR